ncbi:MAG: alpha/beta hydrolase [Sphingosinicella sp.]|nr:alpha/beta hydrolase [Sphingosinicella sp.]
MHSLKLILLGAACATMLPVTSAAAAAENPAVFDAETKVRYQVAKVDGVDIFYREAGSSDLPTILLIHGFPSSSHMYRNLIPALADKYHVIAPDYPGFGHSAVPAAAEYRYTFDNYAATIGKLLEQKKVDRYAIYVMDYGAPVGFRVATANPEKVTALIAQNGNAYEEGLEKFWDPIRAYWKTGGSTEREAMRWATSLKATHWQYTHGVKDLSLISPDAWTMDQAFLDRPGNQEIQLDLFYDYRTNLPLYPKWQEYFRNRKPPTLVLWGKNDEIFVAAGAEAYRRDNQDVEVHLLDTGHFALETHGPEIAGYIRDFLGRRVR